MKKQITEISMLTGDLYYDYVQPAAIAAGITEEVTAHHDTWGDYTTYHVDAAAADQIGHCMYCACMNAHIALHQYGSEAEARQMLYQLEVSIKYHPETAEPLTALRNAIAAMLPQEAQEATTTATAAEAEQQPTETENAPQAATQAAEEATSEKEEQTMTTAEREALERINARQNAANLFTNITPADIAAELAAMEAERTTPAPDPDAATLAPAEAAQVWTEEGKTVATATEAAAVAGIIRRQGGYRERDLLTRPHEMTHGETWNAAHKVVYVTETTPGPDGYCAGCAVDIVTRAIVG